MYFLISGRDWNKDCLYFLLDVIFVILEVINKAGKQVDLWQVEESVVDVNPGVIQLYEFVWILGIYLLPVIIIRATLYLNFTQLTISRTSFHGRQTECSQTRQLSASFHGGYPTRGPLQGSSYCT